MIAPPPKLEDLRYNTALRAGRGRSTVIIDLDFETFSPAGFIWSEDKGRYVAPKNAAKKGLPSIGAAVYSEHPDAEVLCMAYNLKNGSGPQLWKPGDPLPTALFDHLNRGYLIEAWNCPFEQRIWENVCQPKYGFPPVNSRQWRDAAAKARAFALPGRLAHAGEVLQIENQKLKDGERLLKKFSMPRNPTKANSSHRIRPEDDPDDAARLYEYNLFDIKAEAEISSRVPDIEGEELEFWFCDQAINKRGVGVDVPAIKAAIQVIEAAYHKYNQELCELTEGRVQSASEIQKLRIYLNEHGFMLPSLDASVISELLGDPLVLPHFRRMLEIRDMLGSAAVKKLYAMMNQVTAAGRLHDLFVYHSARTGRAAGRGPQPQNLPNSGPPVTRCADEECNRYFGVNQLTCPWCETPSPGRDEEWNAEAADHAIETIKSGSLELVEFCWNDPIATVSACLRGMFIPAEGCDFICSDYSAIEAVVLAAIAGEEWRLDVFRTHGMIYEMSASKITGVPFAEFLQHKADTGAHHPLRKKVGKVAELASGYQGWIGAWRAFGADEFFSEREIKEAVLAWRKASPKIVEMWGGQKKNYQPHFYGLEGAAVQAVLSPGEEFSFNGITYICEGDILYCRLLSGRHLTYHKPRLAPSVRHPDTHSLSFEGWNSNPKFGMMGWVRMETYGGKLTENVVQATARDILSTAIVRLFQAGYPVVLHVHDEIVAEVPEGWGSVEEFERIMADSPDWAKDWPIKATGGWRAKRYSK